MRPPPAGFEGLPLRPPGEIKIAPKPETPLPPSPNKLAATGEAALVEKAITTIPPDDPERGLKMVAQLDQHTFGGKPTEGEDVQAKIVRLGQLKLQSEAQGLSKEQMQTINDQIVTLEKEVTIMLGEAKPESPVKPLENKEIDTEDSRRQAIKEELIQGWEATHGPRWQKGLLRADFQDFMYGDPTALKRGQKTVSLDDRVNQVYRERYATPSKTAETTTQPSEAQQEVNPPSQQLEENEKAYLAGLRKKLKLDEPGAQVSEKDKARFARLERLYEGASIDGVVQEINVIAKDAQLSDFSSQSEVALPQELQNASFRESADLRNHLLSQLQKEVEMLVSDSEKQEKLMKSLRTGSDLIVQSWDTLGGTRNTQDVYRNLRFAMLNSVAQERQSELIGVGDHGINHTMDWDAQIAVNLAQQMGLPPEAQLRLWLTANIHDEGYILPEVAQAMRNKDYGADWKHALTGAKMFRSAWDQGYYKGLYSQDDHRTYSRMHDGVLTHDDVSKIDIRHEDTREMSLLRFADISAVFYDKIPPAIRQQPEALITAMTKISHAKDIYTKEVNGQKTVDLESLDISLEMIREEAYGRVEMDENLLRDQKDRIQATISHLDASTPDFLAGRLSYSVNLQEFIKFNPSSGQIEIQYDKAAELQSLFGKDRATVQVRRLLEEFGIATRL